ARLLPGERGRRPPGQGADRHRQRPAPAGPGRRAGRVVHVVPRPRHHREGRPDARPRRPQPPAVLPIRCGADPRPVPAGAADAGRVGARSRPEPRMRGLMEADGAKYQRALAEIGARPRKTEAVSTLALRYEADLDLATAAAELGLAPAALKSAIERSEPLARH